jgi:cation diffusion facilitator CzcD-associated flavoprotein CzcO
MSGEIYMPFPGRRAVHEVSVAIVGAGVAGIATAVKLKAADVNDITIFERSAGVGGTWYDNTYPGAEVDVNSFLYSFSFQDHDWARSHATQPELLDYIEATVDRFDLRRHLRLSTQVDTIAWEPSRGQYRVSLGGGNEQWFHVVISCVGLLNNPNYPTWPNLDDFDGPKFHTSRWEHNHDLTGKRVAIVGTGSTAAQIVPAIAPVVGQLTVFQREPGWVLPKDERDFSNAERQRFERRPVLRKHERYKEFRLFTNSLGIFANDSEKQREMTALAHGYIESQFSDPHLRAAVTPSYPLGCKRIVLSSTFYPALNRPNVTLVPHAVVRATRDGLVASDGVERQADVLILATGFKAQEYLASVQVTGMQGRKLHEVWQKSPRALIGTTVPGFPNFFMLYGPNTNGGGSIIFQLERQAELVVRQVTRLRRSGARYIDTRKAVYERYNVWLAEQMTKYFDAASPAFCHNYYFSQDGRNVTQWPRSALYFHLMTRFLPMIGLSSHR